MHGKREEILILSIYLFSIMIIVEWYWTSPQTVEINNTTKASMKLNFLSDVTGVSTIPVPTPFK